jgi:hypothetical protein
MKNAADNFNYRLSMVENRKERHIECDERTVESR